MGMYTELNLSVRLKASTPPEVIQVIYYMLSEDKETDLPCFPEHPLFRTGRWSFMLNSSSYYFISRATFRLIHDSIGGWILTGRSDLKNYDDEIEHFVDWLTPYIDACDGEFLGYSRYEECREPTLLYHPNKWVEPT